MRKWLSIGLVIVVALSLVIGILSPAVVSAKEKGAADTVTAYVKALSNLKKTAVTAGYWVTDKMGGVKDKLDAIPKDTKITMKLVGKLNTTGQDGGPATVTGTYKIDLQLKKQKQSLGQKKITFTLEKKGDPKKYPWLISNCDLDLASLSIGGGGAGPTPTAGGPVKIGVVHDFSGSDALSGAFYGDRLIKLSTKQMKDQGGVLGGREVQYIKYDSASTLAGCQTAATKAVKQDHVSVIIEGGSASVNGDFLTKFAEENKTLYINLFVLPLDISKYKYSIRPGYRMDEMDAMCEFAVKVLKAKTIGILARDFEEDRMYGASWKKIIEAAGGKAVYEQYYALGLMDFSPYLTKIKSIEPDVLLTDLLLADYPTMASQMPGLGGWGKTKVICSMAATLALKGKDTDGWYVYARWLPVSTEPGSVKFVNEYKAMFNALPDCVMELMYEPFIWAVKAIQLAGTDDPTAVAAAARSGKLVWEDGPQGKLTIGKDGEVTPKNRLIAIVQDGKMTPVPKWE